MMKQLIIFLLFISLSNHSMSEPVESCSETLSILKERIATIDNDYGTAADYIDAAGEVLKQTGIALNRSRGKLIGPNAGSVLVEAGDQTTSDAIDIRDRKEATFHSLLNEVNKLQDCVK